MARKSGYEFVLNYADPGVSTHAIHLDSDEFASGCGYCQEEWNGDGWSGYKDQITEMASMTNLPHSTSGPF